MPNQLFETVRDIWTKALETDVNAGTDFFLAGGHSFLALDITADVSEACGAEVPLRAIFEHPVLADYLTEVNRAAATTESPADEDH